MTGGRPWWHTAVTYEVYIRSFCDSDGDGVGDLEGIRSKLPYLADLGVDAVWITPFYPSPMVDHGYDVAGYYDVDPLFGTLAGFDRLLADAHRSGIRVLVDAVPNHTSSSHPWFREALADPAGPARDRYIFRDPAPDGGPPNNWVSVFGGPAWALDRGSGQYYLHLFAPEQPDLNWRNPEVHAEWERILRFWLDRGVDGFRIDVAHGLYKHPDLPDAPAAGARTAPPTGQGSARSALTSNRPEVHDVYRRWRELCDRYGDDRMMVGEVFLFDPDVIASYARPGELHLAFDFVLMRAPFEAAAWREVIETSLRAHRAAGTSSHTWVLSSHDVARHASRYGGGERGRQRAAAATLVLLALPGAPYLYQGEELGLEDGVVPPERRQDPVWFHTKGRLEGRDGCRTPLPWTATPPGFGFTDAADPWLPFAPDAARRSVAGQLDDPASTLSLYRAALALRRATPELRGTELEWVDSPSGTLVFRRGGVLCALNTDGQAASVPAGGRLLIASGDGVRITQRRLHLPPDTAAWVALTYLAVPST